MDKSRDEILKAKTAIEVHRWIVAHPEQRDAEVCSYFNELAKKEFRGRVTDSFDSYDPEIHYDFNRK